MKTRLRTLACSALITLIVSAYVFGSCMVKPSVEAGAKGATLVFVGKVVKITPAQLASGTYPLTGKKASWETYYYKTDVATFEVTEVFKGDVKESIDVATSADGDAGYKFTGGTWLKVGETYLVYAYARQPAGSVDTDWSGYDKGVARELKAMQESFPKKLAAEINEFNSKVTPYSASICGRTQTIDGAKQEIDELRRLFPDSKRLTATQALEGHSTAPEAWARRSRCFGSFSRRSESASLKGCKCSTRFQTLPTRQIIPPLGDGDGSPARDAGAFPAACVGSAVDSTGVATPCVSGFIPIAT